MMKPEFLRIMAWHEKSIIHSALDVPLLEYGDFSGAPQDRWYAEPDRNFEFIGGMKNQSIYFTDGW